MVGDRVRFPHGPQEFGSSACSAGDRVDLGVHRRAFDLETAQTASVAGQIDQINVIAEPGTDRFARRIAAAVGRARRQLADDAAADNVPSIC